MLIKVSEISTPSFFNALLYLTVSIFASQRLWSLHKLDRGFNTTKFFLLCVTAFAMLRMLSFGTLCILNFIGFSVYIDWNGFDRSGTSLVSKGDTQVFLNKAVFVLVNMADFMFVSMAVLLACVWMETFQSSRRHWFKSSNFRKTWMLGYLIFNSLLYTLQLVMYILLFVDNESGDYTTQLYKVIFITLAAVNFTIPACVFGGWLYNTLYYAGFPYRSEEAKGLSRGMAKVCFAWSFGRCVWGAYVLLELLRTDIIYGTLQQTLLVGVYFVAEIFPCFLVLMSNLFSGHVFDDAKLTN